MSTPDGLSRRTPTATGSAQPPAPDLESSRTRPATAKRPATAGPTTLIVGIGSHHADDQIGWLVTDRLSTVESRGPVVVRQATSPTQLLDWLDGVQRLVICDACQGLGPVGTTCRWNWPTPELGGVGWSGTHDLSLPATLALAEQLGRLPREVVIWAVEGSPPGVAEPLSPQLVAAIPQLVSRIAHDMNSTCTTP